MDKDKFLENISEMIIQLREMHRAIGEFPLSGYEHRQRANNCMDAINSIAKILVDYKSEQTREDI